MPLEILTSATAPPLEEELLARLALLQGDDPFRPVLVVAPTGRLLARLMRRFLERERTLWSIHLLHHRLLAIRIVETAGEAPLQVLRTRDQRALLAETLAASRRPGPLARWAMSQRGALASLQGAMRDLREAGWEPASGPRPDPEAEETGEVIEILAAYCSALRRLADSGKGDAAALAGQAARCAGRSALLRQSAALLHHGAYDLTGANRTLIGKIAELLPVTLFVPGAAPGPAFEHARRTLKEWVGSEAFRSARPVDDKGGEEGRLAALYDEGAAPRAIEGWRLEVVSTAGSEAELEAAARRLLEIHSRAGIPLEEMAIIARSLEPYSPFLEGVLRRDHGLPFTTSATVPLRLDPAVRAYRDLLAVLRGDFPYGALMDFLRSPAVRIEGIVPAGSEVRPDRWDWTARRSGVWVGKEAWTEDLLAWSEAQIRIAEEGYGGSDEEGEENEADTERRQRRVESARAEREDALAVAGIVTALGADLSSWKRCATWGEHSSFLLRLARERLRQPGEETSPRGPAAWQRLLSLLEGLAGRELLARAASRPEVPPVGIDAAFRAVMEGIEGESLPMSPARGPGVAVLDMMQARGLSFRVVIWIGLNAGLIPRRPRPDPILPEDARLRLRRRSGAPVPLAEEAAREERLLVALAFGAARERIVLSWQRADERGRGLAPSIVFRELARALTGRAETRRLTEGLKGGAVPRVVPFHPALRAEREVVEGTGLVPFRDAAAALAARLEEPSKAILSLPSASARSEAPPEECVAFAVRLASFEPDDLSRDGQPGEAGALTADWSPKKLQMMGQCPLRCFFRYGLKVFDRERPAREPLLGPAEIGACAHNVLQRFWSGLLDEAGRPRAGKREAGALAELVAERISGLFREETSALASRVSRRYPSLWQAFAVRWTQALVSGAYSDLRRVMREEARVVGIEKSLSAEIDLGGGARLRVRGRADRMDLLPDGSLRVVDYKSGGDVKSMVDITNALKGVRLQMGVYREMAGLLAAPRVVAEVLPVGPGFEPALREEPGKLLLDFEEGNGPSELVASFRETLRVLSDLAAAGRFPLNEEGPCGICEYDQACRRSHPPSAERVRLAPSFRPYFALKAKTKTWPFPERRV